MEEVYKLSIIKSTTYNQFLAYQPVHSYIDVHFVAAISSLNHL